MFRNYLNTVFLDAFFNKIRSFVCNMSQLDNILKQLFERFMTQSLIYRITFSFYIRLAHKHY